MADLRVKKQGEGDKPLGKGKIVVPLWPFLLLILVLIPALLFFWPKAPEQRVGFFNPVTGQNEVIRYENRRFVAVPNAPKAQVAVDPDQMVQVGRSNGYPIYAPIRTGPAGGGGGPSAAPPAGLYLRTGNDLFVRLRELPAEEGATTP